LQLKSGDIHSLICKNGAGKSKLIRMLGASIKPTRVAS
jgi:ABC-type multidrug transport system ATPase subunit